MEVIKKEKIKDILKSNSVVAIGGFTLNRKPIEIVNEICKSNLNNFHIYTLGGSMDVDLLLKKNKIKKISAAYVGYEGLGISKLLRENVEKQKVEFEDMTEIIYYFRLKAGAKKIPFLTTESVVNSDILKINSACEEVIEKNSGKKLCKISSINPDFCIIHAQKADREGNIVIEEPDFSEKEMARASKVRIFSVEKICEINPKEITIPKEFVDYVIVCENGAYPTACKNNYSMDVKKIMEYLENE